MIREPASVLAEAPPAIEVLSAHKTYPNGTIALQPVDLTIQEGEFVTLLGPSGCGKSTLLKMVAGLLEPTDGRLLLWRKPVAAAQDSDTKKMAFVFQSPTLMPWASVQANVRLPLDLAKVPRAEADARVAEALELVGLARFAKALPRALSGGMQMRVSIARAFATDANILLCDEPFSALDEMTGRALRAEFVKLVKENGKTAVFITHSISEALEIGDRIVVLRRPANIALDQPLSAGTSEAEKETIRQRIQAVLAA